MSSAIIHNPFCTADGIHWNEHEELDHEPEYPDCEDCGAFAGEEHSEKCSVVRQAYLDDIADRAHEERKEMGA